MINTLSKSNLWEFLHLRHLISVMTNKKQRERQKQNRWQIHLENTPKEGFFKTFREMGILLVYDFAESWKKVSNNKFRICLIGHVHVVGGHLTETSVALLAFLCSPIWEIRLYLFLVVNTCQVHFEGLWSWWRRHFDVLLPWFKT